MPSAKRIMPQNKSFVETAFLSPTQYISTFSLLLSHILVQHTISLMIMTQYLLFFTSMLLTITDFVDNLLTFNISPVNTLLLPPIVVQAKVV